MNPDASEEAKRDDFTDRLQDNGYFAGGTTASSDIGDHYAEL